MAGKAIDDDEYVANLLKQDAEQAAKQYRLVGLDAFRSARYVSSLHAKPTRSFLPPG